MNDVWTFNTASGSLTWQRVWPSDPSATVDNMQSSYGPGIYPSSRSRAGSWRVGNTMYLFGGSQGTFPVFLSVVHTVSSIFSGSVVFNDTWQYSPVTNTWTPIYAASNDPSINPPTRFGPAVWVDNSQNLWMWGGLASSTGPGNLCSILSLPPVI